MSSIGAIFHRDGRPIERADLERMANALNRGTAERQKTLIRGSVGFVMCLRSFTPEDRFEQQPMLIGNRWHAVFEGRIDNRDELAGSIGIESEQLRGMPDGQLFGKAIERWELGAIQRLVGEFAGILFDLRDRELIAFRDHVGLRSLVYHANNRSIAVATNLSGLFALPWVPREISYENLVDKVAGASWNVEATDFSEVFSIVPAHIQRFGALKEDRTEYWSMADLPSVRFRRQEEYVEAFKEIFTVAVHRQLRTVGGIGAQVTGGLDSSSVAVTAAEILRRDGKTLHGFTAVPEEGFSKPPTPARYFDETDLVRTIAEMTPNLETHFVRPDHRPILERIDETIRLYDTSFSKVLNNLWSEDIIREARARGVRVVLNGEGGNFTISYGGAVRLAELFIHGHWLGLARELKRFPRGTRKRIVRTAVLGPVLPRRFYRQWRDRHLERPLWSERSFLRPAFGVEHRVEERAREAGFDLHYLPGLDEHRMRIEGIQSFADGALSLASERAVHGVDARAPALDRRVVEFTLGIPASAFLRDGMSRRLVRDAMQDLLPEVVRANTKVGEQAADWFPRIAREIDAWTIVLDRAEGDPDLREMFDFPRLRQSLTDWGGSLPPSGSSRAFSMGFSLPRAVCLAKFVLWTKGAN